MTPFRSAAFRRLWCATLASSGAQQMERVSTAWLALQAGDGPFGVGLVFAARFVPSLLLGLTAGTIADRSNRRYQLIAVSGTALPIMAVIGQVLGAGKVHTGQVVVIALLAGCVQVFDTPARLALVVSTVPPAGATNAMAFNALASRLAGAVGALAAGGLIPLIGVAHCYTVIAALHGAAALLIISLRMPVRPETHGAPAHPPFRDALRGAIRLILTAPTVRTLTISGITCEVFAFSYGSALPVLARDVLAVGPAGLGALNASVSVGSIIALVLLSLWRGRVRYEPLLGTTFAVYGATLLTLATARSVAVAAAVLVVTGICAGGFDVLQQTLLQLAVPEEQRGRAAGIWVLGVGSAPIGNLEMGAMITAFGVPEALLINGALTLIAAVMLLARSPAYRWKFRGRGSSIQSPE